MFLWREPSAENIRRFIETQRSAPFSYPEIGVTRHDSPQGFAVDHNRARLGSGREVYARAIEAVREWRMFDLGWLHLFWPQTPITEGATVAVLARLPVFWSLNACRIVYSIDENTPVERFGFAYGTLPEHAESGEERFTVEWHREEDSVWYEIFACSRPGHPLTIAGYPLARLLQKRFARDSVRAMQRAVQP